MREIEVCSADLLHYAETSRPQLRSETTALALLAHNGIGALAGRQLANALGVPLVPINPLLAPAEIAHIVAHCACKDLLVDSELVAKAEKALALLQQAPPCLHISSTPALSEDQRLHYRGSKGPSFSEADIGATLIYTSGTTGKPKGCLRTAAQEFARANELIHTYSITSKDTQLVACPLAHSAPGIFVRAAHAVGARSIILRRFRAQPYWSTCSEVGASFFFLVPTQYHRLLEECRTQAIPAELRAAIVAGAPLPARLHQEVIDWIGAHRFWQFYGSSETGTIAVAAPSELVSASVGRLAPGVELQVRSEEGSRCQANTIGEMFVRSPTVMSGYQGEPVPAFEDGFVSVGDLGYQDEAGQVFLVDRKNDTIISGGVNVYPAEVEAALLGHPQVRAAVVVGVEDEDWGQRVVALVAVQGACSAGTLRAHCDSLLARYKIPKEIHFFPLEQMPIGASGKPLRRSARAMLVGCAQ
jgi:long-chain acyl-CoA synthetase